MGHQRGALVAVLVIAAVSTGCGDAEPEGTPFYEAVVIDPERMRVEPETVSPGETVELYFPEHDDRGPGFVVERRAGDQWIWEWSVNSDPDAADPNLTPRRSFERDRYEWESGPAFHDEGPHLIPIPEESQTGEYRVCTAPDVPYCARFQVTES